MKRPFVISINAVSGGGKTSLAKLLHESLPESALFCFDEFDETNIYPPDYYEWYLRGENLEEFDAPGMRAAVDAEIRRKEKQFIVLDYPFGRDHSRFRDVIDLSIWVETPLDIALARRILRDFLSESSSSTDLRNALSEDLSHYLAKGRHLYLDERHRNSCDLVLEGEKSLEYLRDRILDAIGKRMTEV